MTNRSGSGEVSSPTSSIIVEAVFPHDAPSKDEGCFLSISCGEDRMKWAMHQGEKFESAFVWTTPYLENTERTVPPCITLNRFLSEQASAYIFGSSEVKLSTAKNAAKMAATRKIPALSIYILVATTTSSEATDMVEQHEADIAYLFRDVPVRLLRLTSQHFFPNEPSQPILPSSRAAALYAAMKVYGTPTLLIEAGVTMTYLAIDNNSALLGGGVGMGLKLRFDSLFDYSGSESVPEISYDTFRQTLEEAMEQQKPIPLFALDSTTSMMGAAVSEASGQLRNLANQFLEKVKPTAAESASSNMHTAVTMAITGDDTPFVQHLFKVDCSHICDPEPDTHFPTEDKIKVIADMNLMSVGISHLLHIKSVERSSMDSTENLRDRVLGLRGARADALLVDYERKPGIYRGTIVRVVRGKRMEEDSYEIVFDNDGEKELLTQVELYDALRLYEEVRESSDEENKLYDAEAKQESSRMVQDDLVDCNKAVLAEKEVLDHMRETEGSVASILGTPTIAKRGKKRSRSSKTFEGDPKIFLNKRVAKWFNDDELYFGTIDAISRQDEKDIWWHVLYDDDDQEDFDIRQVRKALQDYEQNKGKDPTLHVRHSS